MSKQRVICTSCEKRIVHQSFCPFCGNPTAAATHAERIMWEMGQWESSRTSASARSVPPRPTPTARAAATTPRTTSRSPVPRPLPRTTKTNAPVRPAVPPAAASVPAAQPARPKRRYPGQPRPAAAQAVLVEQEQVEAPPIEDTADTDENRVLLIRRLTRRAAQAASSPPPPPVLEAEEAPEPPAIPVEQEPVAPRRPVVVAEQTAPKPDANEAVASAKLSRRELALQRTGKALGLVEGESIIYELRGRTAMGRAQLVITTYRVAIVGRNIVRWIPLEEVADITTAWRGAPTVFISATIEHLRFKHRSARTLGHLIERLQLEVKAARVPGSLRHNAELIQQWCDRTGEVWDSNTGRFRLFIRRHPVFVVSWLSSIVPVAYLAAQR